MSELRQLVEKRREEEAREDVMDITKQDGLGGFYRYMFQQKTASREPVTDKVEGQKTPERTDEATPPRSSHPRDSQSNASPPRRRYEDDNVCCHQLSSFIYIFAHY